MAPLVTKRLINTVEYYKMAEVGMLQPNENVELINGEIYTMTPIGSKHAAVVRQLSTALTRSLGDKAIISTQQPVHVNKWNELQPDIAVLKGRKDNYYEAHPNPTDVLIIIEVADTSYNFDHNVKLPIYASSDIPAYWIIHLRENCIAVYEEPVNDDYRKRTLYLPGDQISILKKSFDVSKILIA